MVQAYQKRCPFVIDYLIDFARQHKQNLMVRLVKGAYWDNEIKWAQVEGLNGYPFTPAKPTPTSPICLRPQAVERARCHLPQFATHNAYTLAAIYQMG